MGNRMLAFFLEFECSPKVAFKVLGEFEDSVRSFVAVFMLWPLSLLCLVLNLDLSVNTFRLVAGFAFFRMGTFSQSRPQGVGRTRRTREFVAVFML